MPLQERRCVLIAVLLYTFVSFLLWYNFSTLKDTSELRLVTSIDDGSPTTTANFLVRQEDVCDTSIKDFHYKLQSKWGNLDRMVRRNYSQARVSGGIFLYPRQTAILSHLTCRIQQEILSFSSSIPFSRKMEMTICETGFGSGHSMALFQAAILTCPLRNDITTPRLNTTIVSFDKFDRPYQLPMWNHLNQTIHKEGMQHKFVAGDSCKTVPQRLSLGEFHCDILHGSSLCPTDNIDLVAHSSCGTLLTSTAMDELNDHAVYFGPRAQWRKLREGGCITPPVCFQEDKLQTLNRDFVFAKEGSNITGKFCIAVTTGKCNKGRSKSASEEVDEKTFCSRIVQNLMSRLELERICPLYRIPVPP
ncbi:hypothetical protein IV203_001962 [Nitzschia inconspicua]|uniref:Uncharacterized protein n=1 Tax=Nitzschia inconspicua TaxID=303405 RepID=A0A9K3L7G2_9STRA|nr:hypothetical protein IV203_001962 [Nitzschia inconspicua]